MHGKDKRDVADLVEAVESELCVRHSVRARQGKGSALTTHERLRGRVSHLHCEGNQYVLVATTSY